MGLRFPGTLAAGGHGAERSRLCLERERAPAKRLLNFSFDHGPCVGAAAVSLDGPAAAPAGPSPDLEERDP